MSNETTVTTGAIGGAASIVTLFVAGKLGVSDIPAEVGAAVAVLFTAALQLVIKPK